MGLREKFSSIAQHQEARLAVLREISTLRCRCSQFAVDQIQVAKRIINAATVANGPGNLAIKPSAIPSRFGKACPSAIMIGPKDAQAGNNAFESLNTCNLPFVVCFE